jgi:hypothetical protein
MSKIHVSRSIILYLALFLVGVLVSPLLSSLLPNSQPKVDQSALAQAGSPDAVPNSPDEPDFSLHLCTPDYVGEFIDRVHVHCTTAADSTIHWFATPTSDSKRAARVYSTLLTAIAAGKNVRIYYDNISGAAFGCSYSDCRPIKYIEIVK